MLPTASDSSPVPVGPSIPAPAWVDVRDLEDLLDEVEQQLGSDARQTLELSWDGWEDAVEPYALEHKVRVWPGIGIIETASVARDDTEDAQPMAIGALDENLDAARDTGRFIALKSEEQANEALRAYGQQLYFWVDAHRHSGVDYAVSGTRYTTGFDVSSGTALFVPDQGQQAEYKKLRKTLPVLEARRTFVDRANVRLSQFSAWENGEVYSVEVRAFDRLGASLGSQEDYGLIGDARVEHALDDLSASLRAAQEPAVVPADEKAPEPGVRATRPRAP